MLPPRSHFQCLGYKVLKLFIVDSRVTPHFLKVANSLNHWEEQFVLYIIRFFVLDSIKELAYGDTSVPVLEHIKRTFYFPDFVLFHLTLHIERFYSTVKVTRISRTIIIIAFEFKLILPLESRASSRGKNERRVGIWSVKRIFIEFGLNLSSCTQVHFLWR